MNDLTQAHSPRNTTKPPGNRARWVFAPVAGMVMTGTALAQPAQRPLLVSNTGAAPNIVVSLDNSSSMGRTFPDEYVVTADGHRVNDPGPFWAQRSAEVNSMYYNPRVTYQPRVNANNQPLVPGDDIRFISNADSTNLSYRVFAQSLVSLQNGGPTFVHEANNPPYPDPTIPAGWVSVANQTISPRSPINRAHGPANLSATTPPFTYVICRRVAMTAQGQTCEEAERVVDVRHNATAPIALPGDHQRTDCAEGHLNRCSPQEEIRNIILWYRYYNNRIKATQTALGQAFQSSRLRDNLVRIGYRPINLRVGSGSVPTLGVVVDRPHALRGVRTWARGSTANQQFYDWLYNIYLSSGTPLVRAYNEVGQYFGVSQTGAQENPWARNPTQLGSATNEEMNCRRSYHVALSDGGWTDNVGGNGANNGTGNEDATAGPTFTRSASGGLPATEFTYQPQGLDNNRLSYTPYPSPATGGVSDLAARFYWHLDLRPNLDNHVPTRTGQPTFWQNVRTYAIGYMIKPTGEKFGATSGLTFDQINTYRREYLLRGYAQATKPRWPEVGLLSAKAEEVRVDDFIQSGYSGGGRSFSVDSAEGIRSAIDAILSDILDASGNDAGIALGSAEGAPQGPLTDRLKFKVEYHTADKIGNVIAQRLDRNGNPVPLTTNAAGETLSPPSDVFWSAQQQIPGHADRQIFSLGDKGGGVSFSGRFDQLPVGIRTALLTGENAAHVPGDASLVNYLRGMDPALDTRGHPYRLRASRMGAIVNSPPVLLGASQHHGYQDTASTVSGKGTYAAHRARINLAPDVLFVATNAGQVHAIDADNGREIAAFMPRRSMRRLLNQADPESNFQYVLDGPISVQDVYDGAEWSQLVVGTGGRGERLVYGLRARLNAQGEPLLAASDYRWETGPDRIDAAIDGDNAGFASGHMTNPARGGQTAAGHWVVVINSGHYNGRSDGSNHGLVVLDARNGTVLRTISLPSTHSAGDGLGGITLVRDAGRRIVAAYAGDARGHLWRFDLRGEPSTWRVSYGRPLFTTEGNRPIYAAPAWQAHPQGGTMVVVGTGIALDENHLRDTAHRNGIFGIWDPTSRDDGTESSGFETIAESQLLEQHIGELRGQDGNNSYHAITRNKIDWSSHKGWKLLFSAGRPGERVIEQVANVGSSVSISTMVLGGEESVEESCSSIGTPAGGVYVLNELDGGGKRTFDIDGDGRLDDVAMVFTATGGYGRGHVLASTIPAAQMTPAQLRETQLATQHGEGDAGNTSCRAARFALVGVNNGAISGGVQCSQSWARQQYQLTRPPQ